MNDYFQDIPEIKYEGKESDNPLSFKYYDQDKIVDVTDLSGRGNFVECEIFRL